MTSTMEMFAANDFEPIEIGEFRVRPFIDLPVGEGDRIELRWLSANSSLVQGIALRLRDPAGPSGASSYAGDLEVDGTQSPVMSLWQDTAPAVVVAAVRRLAVRGAVLRINNQWRQPNGREDAWLNNFGIVLIDTAEREWELRCSDGLGEKPDFTNLVVSIKIRIG